MSHISNRVIFFGHKTKSLHSLQAGLELLGRQIFFVTEREEAKNLCTDSLRQIIVFLEDHSDELIKSKNMLSLSEEFLCVVVLSRHWKGDAASYFKTGAVDVWFEDISNIELELSFARLGSASKTRIQAEEHQYELQRVNTDLQKSMDMLKSDQIAGVEVQKSLMPNSPLVFGDYEISHSVNPSLYLSGDFVGYNFVLDRFLVFYFVDVSGHGSSSAFVTIFLRFMVGRVIRRHEIEKDLEALNQAPDGLLEHLNKELLVMGLGKHFTIVAGCLDIETNILRYVVGAQMPRPILIVSGNAHYLPGRGKPVGIFDDAKWQVEELALPDRCALVLMTDGVFELIADKDLIDKENTLLSFLGDNSDSIEALKKALSPNFRGDPQDDVSMLLLTRGM